MPVKSLPIPAAHSVPKMMRSETLIIRGHRPSSARPDMIGLLALPDEVIADVAYEAVSASNSSALADLRLVCSQVATALAPDASIGLYSRLFGVSFDLDAPRRRLGEEAVSALNLATEYVKRQAMLKRFSSMDAAEALLESPQDLWTAYLMVLENDGKNVAALRRAGLPKLLRRLLPEAARRQDIGFPVESPQRSLAVHLRYLLLSDEDLVAETDEEKETAFQGAKVFTMAAHKYSAHYAPWAISRLPVLPSSPLRGRRFAIDTAFDQSGRTELAIQTIEHFGQQLTIACPLLSHAAILTFFLRLDREPSRVGMFGFAFIGGAGALPRSHQAPLATLQSSQGFDTDFARLMLCHDPTCSPGLPRSAFKGSLDGTWTGTFAFFDFDAYRSMLAGRMQSLYASAFGDQPQAWSLTEKRVRLPAGYAKQDLFYQDADGLDSLFALERQWETVQPEQEDDDTEIIVTGSGQSAWGNFYLKGRLRRYDGLLVLLKEYRNPAGRGRWMYRGYFTAGGKVLVGRWRDCFSPLGQPGFEGAYVMVMQEPPAA